HLLEFLVGRELMADSIAIEKADINLTPAFVNLFPDFSGRTPAPEAMTVAIKELSLHDVNLRYSDNLLHLTLQDVATRMNDIRNLSWPNVLEQLNGIDIGSLAYSHKTHNLSIAVRGVHLTPSSATIRQAELVYDSL